MQFLCLCHRQQLKSLTLAEQRQVWLLWMENALWRYERGECFHGIAFSGSAFEIACMASRDRQASGMPVELTLAAILVAKLLREQGEPAQAEAVLARGERTLMPRVGPEGTGEEIECLRALADPVRQPDFFADYLNWPGLWCEPSSHQSLAYH